MGPQTSVIFNRFRNYSRGGGKKAGRGVVYSSSFSNEVKNVWSHTSTPYMPSWRGQAELYLFMKMGGGGGILPFLN